MNTEPKEKVLHELLYDKRGKFNVDVLLDCIVALYNDCNAPAIKERVQLLLVLFLRFKINYFTDP